MENSRTKQFVSFKFRAVLISVAKARGARGMTCPFVWGLHSADIVPHPHPYFSPLSSHLSRQIDCFWIIMVVFKSPLLNLTMAPERERGFAGNWGFATEKQ